VIFQDMDETTVAIRWDDSELFRYVYRPDDPVLESPRPYLHPVRTLGGDLVTLYRPHDHVWHKGISLALPNAGPHNFWGGPTYVRGEGYVQLPNNGTTRHEEFEASGDNRLTERLTWLARRGAKVAEESRRLEVSVWPDAGVWALRFETSVRNVSGGELRFGSPTTQGRPSAGYGGLFWRGPRSFTGGKVMTPEAEGGDELMGVRAPWLAFAGQHDGHGRWNTLIFLDDQALPGQWFVRSTPFAAVCPAPFFAAEHPVATGEMLNLRYVIIVCDRARSTAECGELAAWAATARAAGSRHIEAT
jgi:hypothetical protein